MHTYPTTDTFIVRLIAGKCGMQDTSETNIIITPMGIFQQGNGLQPEWQIFPNPANSFVRVRMRGESNFNYEIFNLTGSEVQNGRIDEDHDQVEISSLPDGMYFFRLFDPGSVFSGLRKIIKISK